MYIRVKIIFLKKMLTSDLELVVGKDNRGLYFRACKALRTLKLVSIAIVNPLNSIQWTKKK